MPVRTGAVAPHDLWGQWGGEPLVLLLVLATGWVYARGTVSIWEQVGRGRLVRGRQVAAFATGLLLLLVALASPLDALAGALFSAHMAQHTLLTVLVAPLLVLGAPALPLRQGLPVGLRRRLSHGVPLARALHRADGGAVLPLLALAAHAGAIWLWHLPVLYELALRSALVHAAEHATLLGTALLLWRTIAVSGRRAAFGHGTGIALVFATALLHGGLGAVLTFAPAALYPAYGEGAALWGLDPLHDQHLAGVLMWGPAKVVHGIAAVALVLAWLRGVEARTGRRERHAGMAG